jgi:fibronectin type 3 domain-containing protein
MLDPRQYGSDNEQAELIAARKNNENYTANCQTNTNADYAIATVDKSDDGSVSGGHG